MTLRPSTPTRYVRCERQRFTCNQIPETCGRKYQKSRNRSPQQTTISSTKIFDSSSPVAGSLNQRFHVCFIPLRMDWPLAQIARLWLWQCWKIQFMVDALTAADSAASLGCSTWSKTALAMYTHCSVSPGTSFTAWHRDIRVRIWTRLPCIVSYSCSQVQM